MVQRKVTAIPATISRYTATPINSTKKRRVAGYARVSTDHEDQTTSYEAQVDYYTNYIKSRDDWEFVAIYTDEGISATTTKKREGFKTMIADALARENRSHHHQEREPFRKKYGGQPYHGAKAEGRGHRDLFRERKHMDAGFQGRAAHHHHVEPCAGRKPLHFRKRHLGAAQAHGGRQGQLCLQSLPRSGQG